MFAFVVLVSLAFEAVIAVGLTGTPLGLLLVLIPLLALFCYGWVLGKALRFHQWWDAFAMSIIPVVAFALGLFCAWKNAVNLAPYAHRHGGERVVFVVGMLLAMGLGPLVAPRLLRYRGWRWLFLPIFCLAVYVWGWIYFNHQLIR